MVGRFHWIYMVGASFWVILGVLACAGILGASTAWHVNHALDAAYPNLPDHLFWKGWDRMVARDGGYVAIIRDSHIIVRAAAMVSLVLGILLFLQMIVVRSTTEIAITSSRLILKEGIISRNVDEMSVDRIESVHVIQSILGRILGYGTVMVRGMGIGEIVLPPVADPIGFRNALEKARQLRDRGRST